jgi:hypothetical protein
MTSGILHDIIFAVELIEIKGEINDQKNHD